MKRSSVNGRVRWRLNGLILLIGSSCALSQEPKIPDTPELLHLAPSPSDRFPAKWYPSLGDRTDVVPAPVLDRPYKANVSNITLYRQQNGSASQDAEKGLRARDRSGRTRNDSVIGSTTVDGKMIRLRGVQVYDPVSHCEFDWTELNDNAEAPIEWRVAFVTCGPRTLRYKDLQVFEVVYDALEDGTVAHFDGTTKTEHLVPIKIDGLTVERLRVTNTRLDENGKERSWTGETWYSPDIKEVIRQGDDDVGYEGLTEIRREDPDPKLFYPPDGYKIELRAERKPQ